MATHQHCSFCGRSEDEVKKLLSGPNGVCICDECVETCSAIIQGESIADKSPDTQVKLLKPEEIKAELDKYVVGQDAAKKNFGGSRLQSLQTRAFRSGKR